MHYFKDAVPSVLWISILSAFATCILGFMLATGEGEIGKLVSNHMWGGVFTTILIIIALFTYELNPGQKNKILYTAYIVVLIISIGTLTIGSHHGASLVHGQDYLYEKAPSAIKNLIGGHEDNASPVTYDTPAYQGLIKPIFEQNCYSCHSELKEKGHYKMDTYENLLAGGKSETAGIVPGIATHSEVFTRITLPVNDEKRMPPLEKPQLANQEIVLIDWWIQTGGSPSDTIDDLSYIDYPDEVEEIITTLIYDNNDPKQLLDFNTFLSVSDQLKKAYGIDVILNSQNLEDGLYVVTRNAKGSITTDALNDLAPLAGYVTSINLWKRGHISTRLNRRGESHRLE